MWMGCFKMGWWGFAKREQFNRKRKRRKEKKEISKDSRKRFMRHKNIHKDNGRPVHAFALRNARQTKQNQPPAKCHSDRRHWPEAITIKTETDRKS